MKYYKINQDGMAEILDEHGDNVNNYKDVFRDGYLYLREDEKIPFYKIIERGNHCLKIELTYLRENIYIDAYLNISKGEDNFKICHKEIKLKNNEVDINELCKNTKEELLNRTFSFNKAEELDISLCEEIDYEEITEEEYKENKVK